jgi:hypothetical protein
MMEYIENSVELTGYKVTVRRRDAFRVAGYTLIVPPGKRNVRLIPEFWRDVVADGRLDKLRSASRVPPWVLGLGSWDPECPEHGQRYTICIEQTAHTDLRLAQEYPLFAKEIGASDWLCFELTQKMYDGRFWRDNPYAMMGKLGYQFHVGSLDVGLHFDAYPPGFDFSSYTTIEQPMEFWITVVKR